MLSSLSYSIKTKSFMWTKLTMESGKRYKQTFKIDLVYD